MSEINFYDQFYSEIARWINTCNLKAVELDFHSEEYWDWVSLSIANISERYNNHILVKRQMVMLYEWLYDMYQESLKNK